MFEIWERRKEANNVNWCCGIVAYGNISLWTNDLLRRRTAADTRLVDPLMSSLGNFRSNLRLWALMYKSAGGGVAWFGRGSYQFAVAVCKSMPSCRWVWERTVLVKSHSHMTCRFSLWLWAWTPSFTDEMILTILCHHQMLIWAIIDNSGFSDWHFFEIECFCNRGWGLNWQYYTQKLSVRRKKIKKIQFVVLGKREVQYGGTLAQKF